MVVVCGFIRSCGDATSGAGHFCWDDAHPGEQFDGGGDGCHGEGRRAMLAENTILLSSLHQTKTKTFPYSLSL